MYIEIEKEVFEKISNISDPLDNNIAAVCSLFRSMMYNKHIVFASRKDLISLLNNDGIHSDVKMFVPWVLSEYVSIYSCRDKINKVIVASITHSNVEYCCDVEGSKTKVYVPLSYFLCVYECKLLTENESDSEFYRLIANYMYSKGHTNSIYSVCLENDSFHGGNCPSKLEQMAKSQKHVLCFVDTDKAYHDGKHGCTYSSIVAATKKAQKHIAIELYPLPVREKENLFPATIYKEFTDNALIQIIANYFNNDEEISDYFDIKEGVKYKQLSCSDSKWHSHYDNLLAECKNQNACNLLPEYKADSCYIPGIGSKLCDNVALVLLSQDNAIIDRCFANFSVKKKETIINSRESILNTLPDRIERYWEEISERIFVWGCCLSRNSFTKIRDWNTD